MKVLFVDRSEWWGGAEECLLSAASDLVAQGHQAWIVADMPKEHLRYYADKLPVVYRHVRDYGWMPQHWPQSLRGRGRMQEMLDAVSLLPIARKIRPDLIHINLLRSRDLFDIGILKSLGYKVTGHKRSLQRQVPSSRAVLSMLDGVVTMSDYVGQEIAAIRPQTRLCTVYEGIEASRFPITGSLRNKGEITRILFPGVLEPRKGQLIALRAFRMLIERYPNLRMIIAGAAPSTFKEYEEELRTYVIREGLSTSVDFLGHVSRMNECYPLADVVLALSLDGEAYGRVAVEAGWYGVPVIATNVGATPEIIEHLHTGVLVQPDSPLQVAEALELLIHDPGLAKRLGGAAKDRIGDHFSFEKGQERFINFFASVLGGN